MDWLLDFGPERLETVVDSMPIIMAKGGRADTAKVALEIADKGHCSSKNLWYHGVKLHDLAVCRPGRMPLPAFLALSRASENDNTVFKEQIAPNFRSVRVFADKIYDDRPGAEELRALYNIEVLPCQRRRKGQKTCTRTKSSSAQWSAVPDNQLNLFSTGWMKRSAFSQPPKCVPQKVC